MRARLFSLLSALAVAGCGGDNNNNAQPDLAKKRDMTTMPLPDLTTVTSDDGGGLDGMLPADDAPPADDGGVLPDMTMSNPPDMSVPPDLTGVLPPDLTGVLPPDLTGVLPPDLAEIPPPDLTGINPPPDLSIPPDMTGLPKPDLPALSDMTAPPDGGITTTVKLHAGRAFLYGVTSDGWAVYHDLVTNSIEAVPLAGGMATVILKNVAFDNTTFAQVSSKVVFIWTKIDNMTNLGQLDLWTPGGQAKTADTASVVGLAVASSDGKLAAYTIKAAGGGADLQLSAPDLTGVKSLVKAMSIAGMCLPNFGFAGTTHVVAGHCAVGKTAVSIESFDATGKKAVLQNNALNSWSADKTGTKVLVTTTGNIAKVLPIGGGAAVTIDSTALPGLMFSDGTMVVYPNKAGALKVAFTKTPAMPKILIAKGATGVLKLSPDNKRVVFRNLTKTGGLSDLYIASTTIPGMPVTLTSKTDGSLLSDDSFTADSSRVLYFTNFDPTAQIGDFLSQPVAGGMAKKHGSNTWNMFAVSGAKVVYVDNYTPQMSDTDRADIEVGDTAAGTFSTVFKQADFTALLSFNKDRIVYAANATVGQEGIYVTPVP